MRTEEEVNNKIEEFRKLEIGRYSNYEKRLVYFGITMLDWFLGSEEEDMKEYVSRLMVRVKMDELIDKGEMDRKLREALIWSTM